MKRVSIYARVSTREQNPETQILDLRSFANARSFTIVNEYVDYASGGRSDRTNYQKLLDDVKKRRTDAVLVWKFDRFARSTKELINALEEFNALGVDFISYKENVDTTTPAGKILFTMISAFAEFEREIIRERVRAGMDKAKAKGKKLGRPRIPLYKVNMALDMRGKGIDYKTVIRKLGISKSGFYQIISKK
jgi:DNA invertase Pin-like site-specific DNA recombinase